jgi:hypothetical protein
VIRASDLIGCRVETESGKRLGLAYTTCAPARWTTSGSWWDSSWGAGAYSYAWSAIPDLIPLVRGDVIPWEGITQLQDGLVIVREGTAPITA